MESGNDQQSRWREREIAQENDARDQSWRDHDRQQPRDLRRSHDQSTWTRHEYMDPSTWTPAPPPQVHVRAVRRRLEGPPPRPEEPEREPDQRPTEMTDDRRDDDRVDGEPMDDDDQQERRSASRPNASRRRGNPRLGRRPIPAEHPRAKALAAAAAASLPKSAAGYSMCQEQQYTTEILALVGFLAIIGLILYLYKLVKRKPTELVNQQPAVAVPLLHPTITTTTEECQDREPPRDPTVGELRQRQPASDREVDRIYFSTQATTRERCYHYNRDCRGLRPAKQVCSAAACKICVKPTPPHLACRMPCQHPTCMPDPPRRLQHSGMRCGLRDSHWDTGVSCNCGNHAW